MKFTVRVRVGGRLLSPEHFNTRESAEQRGRELTDNTPYTFEIEESVDD